MKERPILFSAPMVRAILEGRKTQTRRVVKRTKVFDDWHDGKCGPENAYDVMLADDQSAASFLVAGDQGFTDFMPCPYGQPGDRLWVRETWGTSPAYDYLPPHKLTRNSFPTDADGYRASAGEESWVKKWRPSIHMPRWASRITLEIVSVRVERLQDISEEDAKAEGVPFNLMGSTHRVGFENLWNSINGCNAFDPNPWVWVVEFKRIKP